MSDNNNDYVPELILDIPEKSKIVSQELVKKEVVASNSTELLSSNLTEKEKAMVVEFAKKINITDSTQVLQYGNAAQKKIADFSESALDKVRTKDMSEVGDMITSLVVELKGFSADEQSKGFLGLFKKAKNKVEVFRTQYDTVEKNVDRICSALEQHKIVLLKDISMLDKMYEINLNYFKELAMYILAGRERLHYAQTIELVELQKKAQTSGKPEDAQFANDFAEKCNRFEKKIHDLDLTRHICIQMGPQIRLLQNNNSILVEKIQSSLVNTIPLWKNQMVITLGLIHSKKAMEAQREVTDMTNELLRKNADALKISTIETAKESERGIVDIETLQHTNQSLISTLDEVLQIQTDGRNKRREAEKELVRMENELKQKLLQQRS